MMRIKFLLKITCYFLIILFFVLFAGFSYVKNDTKPITEGELLLPGLSDKVYIHRDDNGIPHIYALYYDDDVFFALGFVHAQDRFWQMEFQRRVVSGTLSEILGAKTLPMDIYLRTYGFYHAAELAWDSLDQRSKKIVSMYTAGVNAFIQQGHFPLEVKLLHYQPKPWTNIDSIAWQKMMAWNLQKHSWLNKLDYAQIKNALSEAKILTYFPAYPANGPVIYNVANKPRDRRMISSSKQALPTIIKNTTNDNPLSANDIPGKGSNAWVVSPERSVTHNALLANDVHLEFSAPTLWYLVELHGPRLHVTGASIPGLPAIAIGHNDHIAWGLTSGYNDAADIYILNKKAHLSSHLETINIRRGKPYSLTVYESDDGPIINSVTPQLKSSSSLFALKWPALMPGDTTVQSFIKLNYAQDWQAFTNALKDFIAPTQNFLYADVKGNIGYYYPGLLPIRKSATLLPIPATQEFQWQGYIPFAQLPHMYNPKEGYIATANNKVVNDDYAYSLNARWPVPPFRIERIIQLLNQTIPLDLSSMITIQGDSQSQFWVQLKPYLLKVKPMDAECKKAFILLSAWSGEMKVDSKEATIFAYWLNSLNSLTPSRIRYADKTIEPLYLLQRLQKGLPEDEQQQIFHQAIQTLIQDHGRDPDQWAWGKIHHATFIGDALGKMPFISWIWNRHFPSAGGQYTVNVGRYDPENFNHIQGATFREIISVGQWDNSLYMIPMGQSGDPFSIHYDDFNKKWSRMEYVTIPALAPCPINSKHCLVLSPKL